MPDQVRRKRKDAKTPKKEEEKKSEEPEPLAEKEVSLWNTFTSHPLIKVLPIVLIPYFIYQGYYFFRLQHPEMLGLRPAVSLREERQLLIVGSIASGTAEVAADLYEHLHLEVSHEATDASWYFVRDGTISTFLGSIRFLPPPANEKLIDFCVNRTAVSLGFHPKLHRSSGGCSTREQWSSCWSGQCIKVLHQEWGCGIYSSTNNEEIDGASCLTPFRRTLHAVRHPLRTVEKLVGNTCVGDGIEGSAHPTLLTFMDTVFPGLVDTSDSCLEVATKYTLELTRALLDARSKGFLHGIFKVEEATPCDIAELAGFTDPETVVYEPNYNKIQRFCADPFSPAMTSISAKKYTLDKDQPKLEWSDLKAGIHGNTDEDLGSALRELAVELGYDPDEATRYDGKAHDSKVEF